MNPIDRRSFIAALATTAAGNNSANAQVSVRNKASERRGTWFIARQAQASAENPSFDFWSKPWCEIEHAAFLPSEVGRGILWYEDGSNIYGDARGKVDFVGSDPKSSWLSSASLTEHRNGTETLSQSLFPILGKKNNTALVALDSQSYAAMEPHWCDVLPAFRRCYDRVIGHLHIEQRGYRHWKESIIRHGGQVAFENNFSKPGVLCDAVIVTCPSLVENDFNLSARLSTETLVGQLIEQFAYVLLDEDTLEQIAPTQTAGRPRKIRAFALGSVTSTAGYPIISLRDLTRQRELVRGGFGDWNGRTRRPQLIATLADSRSAKAIRQQILGTDFLFWQVARSNRLRGLDSLEPIQALALWPFEIDRVA